MVAAGIAGVLAGPAAPAAAHPFGPPPTAMITADGDEVRIVWESAADDAVAVGVQVGVAQEEHVDTYLEAPAQAALPEDVELAISEAPEVHAYLTDRIVVRQDGEGCDATLETISNFVWDGATLVHRCPEEVGEVEIEISMLHDRHPAYRTFAIAAETADPPHGVFTSSDPVREWDLTEANGEPIVDDTEQRLAEAEEQSDAGSAAARAWWPIAALVGAVLAVSGVAGWRTRRRPRTEPAP